MAIAKAPQPKKLEKQVDAIIVKNTSVAGMLLHRNQTITLPISVAKSLRDQGLAKPVPKVIESHPAPPPPPPPVFEGENEADESEDESDSEDDEE
jgi:hypothetical protein